MGLNLIIDQGNSSAKVAIFDASELVAHFRYEELTIEVLSTLFTDYNISSAIYSSVRKDGVQVIDFLKKSVSELFIELNHTTPLPITVEYGTANTLGNDRVAAAIGAMELRGASNLLVIDAGTAITLDLVTDDGVYRGGNISAGVAMRFKALHSFTNCLPMVSVEGDTPLVGYSTETAIRSGVVRGVLAEIEGYIADISAKFTDLTVFMTGGDASFLVKQIKSCIFEEKNLLIRGLNRILQHNLVDCSF